jgi:para-nitrobenzyl esterase
VTVAGNSAGSAHINHLMASPLARGLFGAAIGQSSGGFATPRRPSTSLAEAEELGQQFARGVGAPDVAALRDLAGADVIAGGHVGAIVDGWLLPDETRAVFERGDQVRVPLLVGTNADEGAIHAPRQTAEGHRQAAALHGALAARFLEVYPAESDEQARRSARRSFSDAAWRWPSWKWASVHTATTEMPAWIYEFEHAPPLPRRVPPPKDGVPGYGAYHTAELFYMWDNLGVRPWDWTPADHSLAATMSGAWVRFVTDGSPAGGDIGAWDPVAEAFDARVMAFGDLVGARPISEPQALELQDQLLSAATGRLSRA